MKLIKPLFNFYINASIHVALAVYAFVRITELYFDLAYNEPLDFFVFFGTISGYNFVKYAGIAKLHHKSLTKNLRTIQIFSLICFVLMCYYASQLRIRTLMFFVPFGVITLLYAVPFLSGFQKNLRSISYLKIVVVGIVWMGFTVFLPIYDTKLPFVDGIYVMGVQRFLMVVVLILPFDIRDLKYDAISLQTIPQKIGVEKTKKLGYILLLICLFLEFLIAPNTNFRAVFFGVFFLLLFLLMRSTTEQSRYYSSFFVEVMPLVWWGLLLGFDNLN